MIDPKQLKEYVIEFTLKEIDLYSLSAVRLLLGTAAVESDMGKYLHQIGGGPAQGIYQMEPDTHACIWDNFLKYRSLLADKIRKLMIPGLRKSENLIGNLYYATAIARVKYFRSPLALPDPEDIRGLAKMWRSVYNTSGGAGTDEEAIQKYIDKHNKYVMNI